MPETPPLDFDPIRSRRTARRFDPGRPLARSLLDRVLTLATFAPSPLNLQPWRFLVVRSLKNRQKLRACTFGESRLTEAPVVVIVLAEIHPDRSSLAEVVGSMLDQGAIGPATAARLRASAPRDWNRGDPRLKAVGASMVAAGTLMIGAESLGLASAWIDGYDDEKVRQGFGIPDDHALSGLIALGHPVEDAPPFPGRLGLDRVGFDEHFGLPWSAGVGDSDDG